jgi:hypothetical protein
LIDALKSWFGSFSLLSQTEHQTENVSLLSSVFVGVVDCVLTMMHQWVSILCFSLEKMAKTSAHKAKVSYTGPKTRNEKKACLVHQNVHSAHPETKELKLRLKNQKAIAAKAKRQAKALEQALANAAAYAPAPAPSVNVTVAVATGGGTATTSTAPSSPPSTKRSE